MKYYTLDDIMELDPCHSRRKLRKYMEGRKRISLSGMLSSKASDADKIWLVTQLMPTEETVEFARWCADSVKHIDSVWAVDAADDAESAANAAWGAESAADATCAADAAARADAANTAARAAVWAVWADVSAADMTYSKARKKQITQLKLIVKENKL